MKFIAALLIVAIAIVAAARGDELRKEPKPAEDKIIEGPPPIKPTKRHIERDHYYRNDRLVVAIVRMTDTVDGEAPATREFAEFLIDKDNWVEVDTSAPGVYQMVANKKIYVHIAGSVVVLAPETGYFEAMVFRPKPEFVAENVRKAIMEADLKSLPTITPR